MVALQKVEQGVGLALQQLAWQAPDKVLHIGSNSSLICITLSE
jgi:hypothetical protein